MTQLDGLLRRGLELLRRSTYAVALTGAGLSTASGIPDFRSPQSGLWEQVDPLEVATIYAFRRRPQDFFDWIRPLAQQIIAAQPNAAHYALADLETYGPLKAVITQNIDMLHSQAGSRTVHEVHGHLREATCIHCFDVRPAADLLQQFITTGAAPLCQKCGGVLKPNVILFGEQLPVRTMNQAKKEARTCDLMLVAGSSLEVAPAGDLPILAKGAGAHLIIVNYEQTHLDHLADVVIHADVADVLPRLAAGFRP